MSSDSFSYESLSQAHGPAWRSGKTLEARTGSRAALATVLGLGGLAAAYFINQVTGLDSIPVAGGLLLAAGAIIGLYKGLGFQHVDYSSETDESFPRYLR